MATLVNQVPEFAQLTAAIQGAAGIVDDNAQGHKMLVKLGEGLTRINGAWAALVAAPTAATLAALEKFIIVEKYPGGSRKRRQSKKKNQRKHNNQ